MSAQTADTLAMFEHIMDVATAKAAAKGTAVTLVVAPRGVVYDFIQAIRVRDGLPPHPTDADIQPLLLYRGAVVFGVQIDENHRYHGVLSCWDSDQLQPDIATCPQLVGTPRPDETANIWEHTIWGVQVEDWMAEYHAAISYLLNSKTEQPLVTAKLLS